MSPIPSLLSSDDEELTAQLIELLGRDDRELAPAALQHTRWKTLYPPCKPRSLQKLVVALLFINLGALAYVTLAAVSSSAPPTDAFDITFARFWRNGLSVHDSERYPADFFGNVMPIPCHSHNDYLRRTPLFAALGSGCVSIEADVWPGKADLYVAHTRSGIRQVMTLRNMYIDPLAAILEFMNSPSMPEQNTGRPLGIFYNNPVQSLTLLVDFKTPDADIFTLLYDQLQPLREKGWLTHWNGTDRVARPITVVASGSVDFGLLIANHSYRDIFYDAPLDALNDESDGRFDSAGRLPDVTVQRFKYNPSNSHLASVKFSRAIGPLWGGRLSDEQMETLRRQIHDARERQLIPRYWGTPRWPRSLRSAIWALLVQEGIGLLNVDDLWAARKGQWGSWPQGGPQT
ncbi:PLC-like phosphodiesterase, TIM beta/alpha-barrel domain [Pleurostoma richardsiae]|uniref:Altered inheritance of mitochondria protein 6 n=1 Tax=Pleurostoma richardsiae TaxID=41990 RepID=A0AA38R1H5_9PEZI|nr:PLC-like phosphodiesterase, TIM beta/alpha-barrel domain [Pleurostoma richardsiae]